MKSSARIEHRGMHREYLTCFESVAITLLKSMGLEDEASLLGRYAFFAAAAEGLEISPRIHPLEREWAEHLELVRHPARTAKELDAGIAAALGRGLPVCLPVDLHAWPHTPHFGKRHQRHYVAVFGVDGPRYRVVCPYYAFEGDVDRRDLHRGYLSPGSELGGLLTLEGLRLRPVSTEEVADLVRSSCAWMLGSAVPESLAEVDPRLLGCAGIRTFGGRVEELNEARGEGLPEVDGLVDLSRHLMAVGYARYWFSRLLAAHATGLPAAGDGFPERLAGIAQSWIAAGKRLAMGVHGRRAPLAADSLRRIARLAEQEMDLFTALRDALAGGRGAEAAAEESEPWPARAPFVAPRGPEEEGIAAAYAEVLGLDRVGREDDFLRLGGDSVLLIRLLSRIREDFGVEVGFQAFFETPTVGRLAARLDDFEGEGAAVGPRLGRHPRPERVPLSYGQQRLWFLDRLQGSSSEYHLAKALRLRGPLDVGALEQALGWIVARHESLRTRFVELDGEPYQEVAPAAWGSPLVAVRDLRALEAEAQRGEVAAALRLEVRQPFDLGGDLLLRVRLLRLGGGEHVLLTTFHHIAADGWSMGVFRRELATFYRAARDGVPAADSLFEPLPVQYADFALWQRSWLERGALRRGLEYWRTQLAGIPQRLEVPGDRPRPARQTFSGRSFRVRVSRRRRSALEALGRGSGATLYMTLVAAFGVLLERYTGEGDVVVGSPVTGRRDSRLEGLIGFFVNSLVMRLRPRESSSFRELLAEVRRTALAGYRHQEVPFERLVEELEPERSLSYPPVFQVLFALQNTPREPWDLEGLEAVPLEDEGAVRVRFDLEVSAFEDGGGLEVLWVYNRDLFDAWRIEQMARHYAALLERVAPSPDAALDGLEMLSREERRALLDGSGALEASGDDLGAPDLGAVEPGLEPGAPELLHEGFSKAARRRPERVALVAGEGFLTYGELAARASALARRLRRRGVGRGSRVGVCLERGPRLVMALLGVLESGGAYLPLDPDYPADRLSWMLADGGAAVVLAEPATADRLPPVAGVEVLDLTVAIGPRPSAPAAERRGAAATGADVAYVIYTSGSTGRPKGVPIRHRSAASFLAAMRRRPGLGPQDVLLAVTTVSFDIAVLELFLPLSAGARVVVASPATSGEGSLLGGALERFGATVLQSTPAGWRMLLAAEWGGRPGLKMLCGGEALESDLAAALLARGGELWNLYGPTEATIYATGERIPPATRPGDAISIGRPLAGVPARVLDRRLEPVPLGVSGELLLGGVQLSPGYLGRPAASAERFVPDPAGPEPGARLYRTGDRARFGPDGRLDYLGRLDQQLKVRGFRIEPGEIEVTLRLHEAVREAAVVARPDGAGTSLLVAYVVPAGEALPAEPAAVLTPFLGERLPPYMVPAVVVRVDVLPLTPAGKVDRKALAQRAVDLASASGEGVAPRTTSEKALARIWAEVLGCGEVGIHDDFFRLGGHSLLATRVLARVRQHLGIDLGMMAFFEHPTVAGQAAALRARAREEAPPPLEASERPPGTALPLSFAQRRLWYLDQLVPGSSLYNIPSAWRLRGALDPAALEAALRAVVERHEILRTTFGAAGGEPFQRPHPPPEVERRRLPVVDLGNLDGRQAELQAGVWQRREANEPFDLARGPLVRARLLRFSAADHLLLVTMHHIVSDGWSMGIFWSELAAFYNAARAGAAPAGLAPLPVQVADVALWQRRWLAGPLLEAELGFWRDTLDGAPQILELPLDRPRPARPSVRSGKIARRLPPAARAALADLAGAAGATLHMALVAAVLVLLGRLSGQRDLCLGIPVTGRRHAETQGLIGFFVNLLVVRGDLAGAPSFRRFLAGVRRRILAAYERQDLPFERLVEELQPRQPAGHPPLVQVVFDLRPEPLADLGLAEIEARRVEVVLASEKFDLTLAFEEQGAGLAGRLGYRRDLFDPTTVSRWWEHLAALVGAIGADPGRSIDALDLFSPAQRHQLLEHNDTARIYPKALTLAELFDRQAALRSDAVALSDGEGALTYGELQRRADRLARHLRGRGVGPEVAVAIFHGRSPRLVIAMLAVVKAAGMYVPLDPSDPRPRLRFLLEDSGASLVLAEEKLRGFLPGTAAPTVTMDELESSPPPEVPEAPGAARPENAAYAIYTSGSTGRPKGVVVPQQAIARLVLETDYLQLEPADRVAQVSNSAFDAVTFEIWGALLTGARLVMISRDVTLRPRSFAERLERDRVTVLFQTTALFNQVAQEVPGAFSGLRGMLFGGETVEPRWPREVLAAGPPERLLHVYGPTESTTFATWFPIRRVAPDAATVPIGRALANTDLWVLGRALVPVAPGVSGELFLGGDGLARAYHRRPGLTADRFVPHPFGGAGERLYRTGDRVRRDAAGDVEFGGRFDQQIKLRGFRIELGEIETALASLPGVAEAVVVPRGESAASRRLVAFWVAAEAAAAAPGGGELREHLKASLPSYMVPAHCERLDAWPMTPSGKIDRRALAELPVSEMGGDPFQGSLPVAPRTPTEELVAGIWSEALGREAVSVEDDFFDLGGQSLVAVRVLARIRQAFGVDLRIVDFFDRPTVAGNAAEIDRLARDESVPPLVAGPPEEEPPLSFTQERFWFLEQMARGTNTYNVPLAVLIEGRLRPAVLERCFAGLLARHEVLRSTYPSRRGLPLQRIAPVPSSVLPVVDLEGLDAAAAEGQRSRLAKDNALRPFDLESGPLTRFLLLRLAAERHVLLLSFHHIVADGWSISLLIREIQAMYGAFLQGRPSPLPPLPIQYRDYARWQRDWLRGAALEAEIDHWRGVLGERLPELVLPGQGPPQGPPRSFALTRRLDLRQTAALRALARRLDVTPFVLYLSAWSAVLGRYGGASRVSVGTVAASRNRLEIEGLIGCFVNTLPLVVDLSGEPTFLELLSRARASTLTAFSHQELPFEKLVEAYNPDRNTQQALFQSFFTMAMEQTDLELEDLRLSALPLEDAGEIGTKFDLVLSVKALDADTLSLGYNAAIYPARLIECLLEDLYACLERIVERPETPLDELPGPTPEELRELEREAGEARRSAAGTGASETADGAGAPAVDERQQVRKRRDRLSRKLDNLPRALRARFEKRLRQAPDGAASETATSEFAASCLVTLQAGGSRAPLFCVHAALGQVAVYNALGRRLGDAQPIYGLQSPGLLGDGLGPQDLEGMARLYVGQVRKRNRGPYRLLGWSMAGVVAFEMARQLAAAGEEVELLALLDSVAPRDAGPPLDELRLLRSFAVHLGFRRDQLPAESRAREMSAAQRLEALSALGHELGVLPRTTDAARLRRLWEVFRTNIAAERAYERRTWDGPVLLLEARQRLVEDLPDQLGWGGLVPELEVRQVPGNHFTMLEEPHVGEVARMLAECLDRASGG